MYKIFRVWFVSCSHIIFPSPLLPCLFLFFGQQIRSCHLSVLSLPEENYWCFWYFRALLRKCCMMMCECTFCQWRDERCLCRCSFLSIIAQAFAGKKAAHNCRVPRAVRTFWLEPWNWNSSALHWRVFYWRVHNFIISRLMNPECMHIRVDVCLCLCVWFRLCLHYLYCR